MGLYFNAYNFILKALGPEILAYLSRKSMKDHEFRKGRLGYADNLPNRDKTPRIWFHAVSVGEINGAVPTLLALRSRLPGAAFFLSAGTSKGLESARDKVPEDIAVLAFPIDFPKCVSRAVAAVRPDIFVAFETEFWPNFYHRLALGDVPALLMNGRVSDSSERMYRFLSPLFLPVFEQFDQMAMGSEEDAERILRIGAAQEKVIVLGSSKYEGMAEKAQPERTEFWKKLLRIGENTPVIVGGSLRQSECFTLPRIFMKMREIAPGALAIFAPRHMHRVPGMVSWLTAKGVGYDLLTDIESGKKQRSAPVVIVNRMGALFELYSTGDLIFCGGTFEPVGGHNILEPAAWGKPVFYGPHLKKVRREHRILNSFGGSFTVADPEDLLFQWKKFIGDPGALKEAGAHGRDAVKALGGVVERQVEIILESLSKKRTPGRIV